MSREQYACIHAGEFPAQALLRLRPDLQSEPAAVLDGNAPLESVCSVNQLARRRGVDLRMLRHDAEAIAGLHLLRRSVESETCARAVLLECAAMFSPRIEDVSLGTASGCVLDITGTERLFGPPDALARRIRVTLKAAGFHASIAVSANFHTARIMAASSRGVVVVPPGSEATVLASLSAESLNLATEHRETLALWGIRTLGEYARLPETELVARLGQVAKDWRKLSCGTCPHTFQPIEQVFELSEFCELDTPLEQSESLLFIATHMIDCLVKRASSRALSLASITIQMHLEGSRKHECRIRPALPSVDRQFLLKLLQLEIAAHPPQAAVTAMQLSAEGGQSSKVQVSIPRQSRGPYGVSRSKRLERGR